MTNTKHNRMRMLQWLYLGKKEAANVFARQIDLQRRFRYSLHVDDADMTRDMLSTLQTRVQTQNHPASSALPTNPHK